MSGLRKDEIYINKKKNGREWHMDVSGLRKDEINIKVEERSGERRKKCDPRHKIERS